MKYFLALLLLGIVFAEIPDTNPVLPVTQSTITSIWPNTGSINGGTYIAINGFGFSRGSLASTLLVSIGTTPCEIDTYHTGATTIYCTTPASMVATDNYAVQVRVTIGTAMGWEFSKCAIVAAATSQNPNPIPTCTFTYRSDKTPIVDWASTSSVANKDIIFRGLLLGDVNMWSDSEATYSFDPRINGMVCLMGPTSMVQADLHDYTCTVADQVTGRYSFSMNTLQPAAGALNGFGKATIGSLGLSVSSRQTEGRMKQVSFDGKSLFSFTQVPQVLNVSPAIGGTHGGAFVTITGTSFPTAGVNQTNRVTVLLSGRPCTVISTSLNEIVCRSGSFSDPDTSAAGPGFYAGSRGLRLRKYLGLNYSTVNLLVSSPPTFPNFPLTSEVAFDSALFFSESVDRSAVDYYAYQFNGYFVPKVTGSYRFFGSGDDRVEVWLGQNASSVGKQLIVSSSCCSTLIFDVPNKASVARNLVAGRRYWIEIRFFDFGSGDYGKVSLQLLNPGPLTALQQQYQSTGAFLTVGVQAAVLREIQTVSFSGMNTGGSFIFTFGAASSAILNWPPSTSAVATAIAAIQDCSSISVTTSGSGANIIYNIQFNCPIARGLTQRTQIQVFSVSLQGGWAASYNTTQFATTPISGYFTLLWNGTETVPIQYNSASLGAYAVAVRSALSAIGLVVSFSSDMRGTTQSSSAELPFLFIQVASPLGPIPDLQTGSVNMTGPSPQVIISTVVPGSNNLTWDPVPADFFEMATANENRVELYIDDIKAETNCDTTLATSCSYSYSSSLVPSVTSLSNLTFSAGDTVTVSGSGFGSDPSQLLVQLLDATSMPMCDFTISAVSDTSLTAIVCSTVSRGSYTFSVGRRDNGFAQMTRPQVTFTYRVDSVSPLSGGSIEGGQVITVTGAGFLNSDVVQLGSVPCSTISTSTTELKCLSQAIFTNYSEVPVSVTASDFGSFSTGLSYTYSIDNTPTITSITPREVSRCTSTYITITGTNFGAPSFYYPYGVNVTFGNLTCRVLTGSSQNMIRCLLTRSQPTDSNTQFLPSVNVWGVGFAQIIDQSQAVITSSFHIYSVSPQVGSIYGGSRITITGSGFRQSHHHDVQLSAYDTYNNYFKFIGCAIDDAVSNETSIQCITSSKDIFTPYVGIDWEHSPEPFTFDVILSMGFINAECVGGPSVCQFNMSRAVSPTVASINPSSGQAGTVITITGTNLDATAVVMVNTTQCINVQSPNPETVTCTVQAGMAGSSTVRVTLPAVGSVGPISVSAVGPYYPNIIFTHNLAITSVTPSSGSRWGGTPITITGQSFNTLCPQANVVTLRRAPGSNISSDTCIVSSVTDTELICVTPSYSVSTGRFLPLDTPLTVVVTVVMLHGHDGNMALMNNMSVADTNSWALAAQKTGLGQSVNWNATDCAECIFTLSSSLPSIAITITPSRGMQNTTVYVRGANFSTYASQQSPPLLIIGPTFPTVSFWNDTLIVATIGQLPAGDHPVRVSMGAFGATRRTTFTSLINITALSYTKAGYGGGVPLTISGFGFGTSASTINVSLCNVPCVITDTSYNSVVCVPGPIITSQSLALVQHALPQNMAAPGCLHSPIASSSFSAGSVFDGNVSSSTVIPFGGWLGLDFGQYQQLRMTRIRFFAAFTQVNTLIGGTFQGCNGASSTSCNWITIATIASAGLHESWNYIDVDQTVHQYRYVRYVSDWNNPDQIAEIELIGWMVAVLDSNGRCGISVNVVTDCSTTYHDPPTVGVSMTISPSVQPTLAIAFNLTSTPVITDLQPRYGSSLGGTQVTVSGSGFSQTLADNVLYFNSCPFPCVVNSVSADGQTLVCTTTGRDLTLATFPAERTSLTISTTDSFGFIQGNALTKEGVIFRFLDKWSEINTWADLEPPLEGDTVVIPKNQAVLLDVSPPLLFFLLIQGTLVFDRRDLNLDSSYILVYGGRMEVGTERNPFLQNVVITLHGDRHTSIELPHVGNKMLAVTDDKFGSETAGEGHMDMMNMPVDAPGQGVLDIHGIPRKRVWCKVATTVPAGATTVIAADDIDFQPGEKFILTGSGAFTQTEELTVVSLDLDNRTLHFTPPARYTHESFWYTRIPGKEADMRVEIGLLSRNIVIKGDDTSASQMYGVHTMAAHGGTYRLENLELFHCGQFGNLGRYCSHFHMAGDQSKSYFKANSVHHSFQRGTTVHGTSFTNVKHNLYYHVHGHTVFVEDGIEEHNVFEENLAGWTLKHPALLASDMKCSSFWTSNPNNAWINNVAFGGQMMGFWFELPSNPGGPSYTPSVCPKSEQLYQWINFTTHSNDAMGMRVYPHYFPYVNPCEPWSGTKPMYLYNMTSWHNGGDGFFTKKCADCHLINFKMIENGGDGIHWISVENVMPYYENNPNIQNALIVGSVVDLPNPIMYPNNRIFMPHYEYWHLRGAHFVNTLAAVSGCNGCMKPDSPRQGGYTYRIEGVNFINVPMKIKYEFPWKDIIWDLDGSFTNNAGGWAIPYQAFNEVAGCTRQGISYDNGLVCDNSVVIRRVVFDNVVPTSINWKAGFITDFSNSSKRDLISFRPHEETGWVAPVVVNRWIKAGFVTQADWQNLRIRYSEPAYTKSTNNTEWLGIHFDYYDYRYQFNVIASATVGNIAGTPILPKGDQASTLPHHGINSSSPLGFGVTDESATNFEIMVRPKGLVAPNNDVLRVATGLNLDLTPYTRYGGYGWWSNPRQAYMVQAQAIECKPGLCNLPPGLNLGPRALWSSNSTWMNGRVPGPGDTAIINNTMWVVMDVNPPPLAKLQVDGMLEFLDNADRTLDVNLMQVNGVLQIGTSELPFQNQATITLHGTRSSSTLVTSEGLFLGNKVMCVLGVANVYGRQRVTWTKLTPGVSAMAGATQISVQGYVDWTTGDKLAISSTEYETTESEILNVAAPSIYNNATNTTVIPLTTPLVYKHVSVIVQARDNGSRPVTLSAVVSLLNRNIVIQGAIDESSNPDYGASIVFSEAAAATGSATFRGSANLDNVQFNRIGKYDTEHPGIRFFYGRINSAATYTNVISNCSFVQTYNAAVQAEGVQNLRLFGNTVFNATSFGFKADKLCSRFSVKRNLVLFTRRDSTDSTEYTQTHAGFFFESATAFESGGLDGNLVASSFDIGFMLTGESCTSSTTMFGRNEVSASRVGIFVLNYWRGAVSSTNWFAGQPGQPACLRLSGFTSWKNSDLGIVAVDLLSNLKLSNVVLSDNHIGINMQFLRFGLDNFAALDNSVVMGSTPASSCTKSLTCRAIWGLANPSQGDPAGIKYDSLGCGSIYKNGVRRVGLVFTSYPNVGKLCPFGEWNQNLCTPQNLPWVTCSTPWTNYYGVWGSPFGTYNVSNTVFAYWQENDCGMMSRAISINNDNPDFPPQITMVNASWSTTAESNARFYLGYHAGVTTEGQVCPNGNCDANNLASVVDLDGSTTGTPNSMVISDNPGLGGYVALRSNTQPSWQGIQCSNLKLRAITFSSQDQGLAGGGQRYGPIVVRNLGTDGLYFARGGTKDNCFPGPASPQNVKFLVEANQMFEVNTTGSTPKSSTLYAELFNPQEFVILKIFYTTPTLMEVRVNGVTVRNSQGNMPTVSQVLANPNNYYSGQYSFDPQARQLSLLIKGSGNAAIPGSFPVIDIVSLPVIQVTLNIAMTVEQFYGSNIVRNIALLLGINPSRIKTVDVQTGSVVFTYQILPEGYNPNSTTTQANSTSFASQQDMFDLGTAIVDAINNGTFQAAIGAEITGASIYAPPEPVAPVASNCTSNSTSSANCTSSNSAGGSGGSGVGNGGSGVGAGITFTYVPRTNAPTNSPTNAPTASDSDANSISGGLSSSAKTGIIVGMVLFVVVILLIAAYILRSNSKRLKSPIHPIIDADTEAPTLRKSPSSVPPTSPSGPSRVPSSEPQTARTVTNSFHSVSPTAASANTAPDSKITTHADSFRLYEDGTEMMSFNNDDVEEPEMTTYQKAKAAQTEKRLQEYESTVPHLPTLVSSQKAAANASRYTVVKFENPTAASPTAGSKDAASSLNSPKANEDLASKKFEFVPSTSATVSTGAAIPVRHTLKTLASAQKHDHDIVVSKQLAQTIQPVASAYGTTGHKKIANINV